MPQLRLAAVHKSTRNIVGYVQFYLDKAGVVTIVPLLPSPLLLLPAALAGLVVTLHALKPLQILSPICAAAPLKF